MTGCPGPSADYRQTPFGVILEGCACSGRLQRVLSIHCVGNMDARTGKAISMMNRGEGSHRKDASDVMDYTSIPLQQTSRIDQMGMQKEGKRVSLRNTSGLHRG
jgi:hypothetical protein